MKMSKLLSVLLCAAMLLTVCAAMGGAAFAAGPTVIGSGFGGGFARLREVCGSFSACTMLAGFMLPANEKDMQTRTANYALVQEMAADFRERNGGSIVCGELLGLREHKQEGPVPSERTAEFYKKRPCPEIIRNAAVIVAERMKKEAAV